MSLARAFTTRHKLKGQGSDHHGESLRMPSRSHSVRDQQHHQGAGFRQKISGPVSLVHTTNMLSYNAPDIHPLRSKPSLRSEQESEAPSTTESTPPTSPEISPVPESAAPEPNHLSTYFMVPQQKAYAMSKQEDVPPVPKRSPSHTKKNSYDAIARSRPVSRKSNNSDHSVSSKASFAFSRSSSTSTRASSTSSTSASPVQKMAAAPMTALAPAPIPTSAPAPQATYQPRPRNKESHPFGNELAQVTELAEEYGPRPTTQADEEDDRYIKSHGLVKFTPNAYLDDVTNLFTTFFPEVNHARTATPLWI